VKKIIILLLIILIVPKSVSSQENYISNYTKFHSDVIESFTDTYLGRYRKLSDGYVNNSIEDGDGIPVFYLYKNEDIYIHTVFLTDGISLVFAPKKFYSNPKTNDFEVQNKSYREYIDDTGLSWILRLEGNYSMFGGEHRIRFKYAHEYPGKGRQSIKKGKEIRILNLTIFLNKSNEGIEDYAQFIADLDFVQDKGIVENYQYQEITFLDKVLKFSDEKEEKFGGFVWFGGIIFSILILVVVLIYLYLTGGLAAILEYGKKRLEGLGLPSKKEKE